MYMYFQVRAIGRGPFYPKNSFEMGLIIVALLFGMVWNIWFFYGLTGGWWADQSQRASDFEDQMGIVETYITVAKQTANADNIRRFVALFLLQSDTRDVLRLSPGTIILNLN